MLADETGFFGDLEGVADERDAGGFEGVETTLESGGGTSGVLKVVFAGVDVVEGAFFSTGSTSEGGSTSDGGSLHKQHAI